MAGTEASMLVLRNETIGKLATVQVIQLGCLAKVFDVLRQILP